MCRCMTIYGTNTLIRRCISMFYLQTLREFVFMRRMVFIVFKEWKVCYY